MNEDFEYYVDLEYLSDICRMDRKISTESVNEDVTKDDSNIYLDHFKYEVIRMCLDKVMFTDPNQEEDEIMKLKNPHSSGDASYRLAFNTLLSNKIIKTYE